MQQLISHQIEQTQKNKWNSPAVETAPKEVRKQKLKLNTHIPIAMKHAAKRPAREFHSSFVRKYVAIAVSPLKGNWKFYIAMLRLHAVIKKRW